MNRKERRAAKAQDRVNGSGVPLVPLVMLDLACAGSMSEPRQECMRRLTVPMPFDLEGLRMEGNRYGWFVTVVTPPGTSPLAVTVLCPTCAEALIPELAAVARRVRPGSA